MKVHPSPSFLHFFSPFTSLFHLLSPFSVSFFLQTHFLSFPLNVHPLPSFLLPSFSIFILSFPHLHHHFLSHLSFERPSHNPPSLSFLSSFLSLLFFLLYSNVLVISFFSISLTLSFLLLLSNQLLIFFRLLPFPSFFFSFPQFSSLFIHSLFSFFFPPILLPAQTPPIPSLIPIQPAPFFHLAFSSYIHFSSTSYTALSLHFDFLHFIFCPLLLLSYSFSRPILILFYQSLRPPS